MYLFICVPNLQTALTNLNIETFRLRTKTVSNVAVSFGSFSLLEAFQRMYLTCYGARRSGHFVIEFFAYHRSCNRKFFNISNPR